MANLAETQHLLSIAAGGPGSGRKSEGMHELAKTLGYNGMSGKRGQYKDNSSTQYQHKSGNGDLEINHATGKFSLMNDRDGNMRVKEGTGAAALQKAHNSFKW